MRIFAKKNRPDPFLVFEKRWTENTKKCSLWKFCSNYNCFSPKEKTRFHLSRSLSKILCSRSLSELVPQIWCLASNSWWTETAIKAQFESFFCCFHSCIPSKQLVGLIVSNSQQPKFYLQNGFQLQKFQFFS